MREVLDQAQLPGVALALVDRGGVFHLSAAGLANRERREPMTPDTPMRIMSLTKLLVAVALARQVERGELDLERPVAGLVPELRLDNPWETSAPVRVIHLLEHSAGLDDFGFDEVVAPLAAERLPLQATVASRFQGRKVRWRPGSWSAYSNPGYLLAGRVLEVVSGRNWRRAIDEEVLAVTGMESTRLASDPELRRRMARGYPIPGDSPVPYRPVLLAPAANAISTARDLGLLTAALISRRSGAPGKLLSPASVRRLVRPESTDAARAGLRLGFAKGVSSMLRGGRLVAGADAGGYAFSASLVLLPDWGLGYVMLVNASHHPAALVRLRTLLLAALTHHLPAVRPPPLAPSRVSPQDLSGWFHLTAPRHSRFGFLAALRPGRRLGSDRHGLWLGRGEAEPIRLTPAGAGLYRAPGAEVPEVLIRRGDDGELTLVDRGRSYRRRQGPLPPLQRLLAVSSMLGAAGLLPVALLLILGALLRADRRRLRAWLVRPALCLPVLSSACLLAALYAAGGLRVHELGQLNGSSACVFSFSLLQPPLAALGLVAAARELRLDARPPGAGLALMASLLCASCAAHLAAWGLVGLRTW